MKLYAVKVATVTVPEDADTQTKGIAAALEQQRHTHVYLGQTWGEAEGRLRDALDHIRELQLVTGRWEVEVAGQDIRENMRLSSTFFVGDHDKIIFPAQASAQAEQPTEAQP